jgi:hypothetical protein
VYPSAACHAAIKVRTHDRGEAELAHAGARPLQDPNHLSHGRP